MEQEDCPECEKKALDKARNEAAIKAAEEAKKLELPELEGSEKQVKWALQIRAVAVEFVRELSKQLEGVDRSELKESGRIELDIVGERLDQLVTCSSARWWIDNRSSFSDQGSCKGWLANEVRKLKPGKDVSYADWKAAQVMEEEINQELLLEPEEVKKSGICEVVADEKSGFLKLIAPRDEELNSRLREAGCRFSRGAWSMERILPLGDPLAEEHAAELASYALLSGYRVRVPSTESRQRVLEGDWEPFGTRWVRRIIGKEAFSISWAGYNDELYQAAKRVHGARWSHGSMCVPGESFEEVLDFAERCGFRISEAAGELAAEMKLRFESAAKVGPLEEKKTHEAPVPGSVPGPLPTCEVDEGIADELAD